MDKLIYTALSGAERALHSQQVHANNLANLDTPGFRANLEQAGVQALAGRDGYDGRVLATARADTIATRSGPVRETGRPLDIALGDGAYLAIQAPHGEAYTRAGSLELDADGSLLSAGRPVLGDAGPVVLPPFAALEIGPDGSIAIRTGDDSTPQVVDRLRLVSAAPGALVKNETGLLVARSGVPLETDPRMTVRQGHLEGSNVGAVEEMIATMSLTRSFELHMKLLRAGDSMQEAGNRLLSA